MKKSNKRKTKTIKGIVTYYQIKNKVLIVRIKSRTWVYIILSQNIPSSFPILLGTSVKIKNCIPESYKEKTIYISRSLPEIKEEWQKRIEKEKELADIDNPVHKKLLYILKLSGKNSLFKKFLTNKRLRKKYLDNLWSLYEQNKLDFYTTVSLFLACYGTFPGNKSIDMVIKHFAEELYESCCNAFSRNPRNSVNLSTFIHSVRGFLKTYGIQIEPKEIAKKIEKSCYVKIDREEDPENPPVYPSEVYRWKRSAIKILKYGSKGRTREYKDVLSAIRENQFVILTGPPGSGKTHLLKSTVKSLENYGFKIIYTATTGKAALLLPEGKTLHSVLGWDGKRFNPDKNPDLNNCDILVVDEASMLTWQILYVLLKKAHFTVIFSGDPDQLPPVKGEYVFRQMFKYIPVVRLKDVYRGDMNVTTIVKKSLYEALVAIKALVASFERKKVSWQVIAPLYRGFLGIENLNKVLGEFLKKTGLKVDEKVLITKNIYFNGKIIASNGDTGIVVSRENGSVEVLLERNNDLVIVDKDSIIPAYCISVHKAQGSEYDYVIYCCPLEKDKISKELEYVAKTRGKKETFIIIVDT